MIEDKYNLREALSEHRALGISGQIDFEKFYLYSLIAHSTAIEGSTVTEVEAQLLFDEGIERYKASVGEKMVDKSALAAKLVDNWSIKPSLAAKLADIVAFASGKDVVTTEMIVRQFAFTQTTAKRYLRQLAQFGLIEAMGGNKNRKYKSI